MRTKRVIEINGDLIVVPRYVARTVCGWQTRVRDVPSQHFSDSIYGGAREALEHAAMVVETMLRQREIQQSKEQGDATT